MGKVFTWRSDTQGTTPHSGENCCHLPHDMKGRSKQQLTNHRVSIRSLTQDTAASVSCNCHRGARICRPDSSGIGLECDSDLKRPSIASFNLSRVTLMSHRRNNDHCRFAIDPIFAQATKIMALREGLPRCPTRVVPPRRGAPRPQKLVANVKASAHVTTSRSG